MMPDTETEFCDNAGRSPGDLGVVGCWDNGVDVTLRIGYDEHGVDFDVVDVCDQCADQVRKLAENHGYTVIEV